MFGRLGALFALLMSALPAEARFLATDPISSLETTSGANPARDAWIVEQRRMTEDAIANGVYMGSMTRRESIAHLAALVVDHQIASGDYLGAISTAEAIIAANPKDVYVLAKAGTAYGHLLRALFFDKYPTPAEIPDDEVPDFRNYSRMNAVFFGKAEALGWRSVQ